MERTAPCGWTVCYECAGGCKAVKGLDPEAQAKVEMMATEFLWNWTGRVFGVCEETVRPCLQGCSGAVEWASTFWGRGPSIDPGFPSHGGAAGAGSWYPVLLGGRWYNVTCGCISVCSCRPEGPTVLTLPGPLVSVTRITIDGITLPTTAYRVAQGRYLIRTDGEVWPRCQDMLLPDDAPGAFAVTYRRGIEVPMTGEIAAGRLACELAKMLCGDESCALPERLQTVTRQGITVGVFADADSWHETGIWVIDNFVHSVTRPRSRPTARSVDVR